jgi:hypothetical protein
MKFIIAPIVLLFATTANAAICDDQMNQFSPLLKSTRTGKVLASAQAYPEVLKAFQNLPDGQNDTFEADMRGDFVESFAKYQQNPNCASVRLLLAKALLVDAEATPAHRREIADAMQNMLSKPKRPDFVETAIDGIIFEAAIKQNLLTLPIADAMHVAQLREGARGRQGMWFMDFTYQLGKLAKIVSMNPGSKDPNEITAALRSSPNTPALQYMILDQINYSKSIQKALAKLAVQSLAGPSNCSSPSPNI